MPYEPLRVTGSERPTPPEKENRFQEGSLARAVAAPDEVQTGIKTQLGALDAAHVIDNKLSEAHSPKLSSKWQDGETTSAKRSR